MSGYEESAALNRRLSIVRVTGWVVFSVAALAIVWFWFARGLNGWTLVTLEGLFLLAVYGTLAQRAAYQRGERLAMMRRPRRR